MTPNQIINGFYKNSELVMPYYKATPNGVLKVADREGRYIKLYYNNTLYIAEGISETYRGSAYV